MSLKSKSKNNDVSEKYQKLEQREHVLTRPGMYIGSIEEDVYDTWIMNRETNKMEKKQLKYIPGLFKIFDEILVNAIDHSTRLKSMKTTDDTVNLMKTIKVNINQEEGTIEVINDGDGIEIVEHPEHKMYIPELIFGHLLTSTNYDDSVERVIGGLNGLGSKCLGLDTNIPLFNGEIKLAKDIKIGDVLIGDDGNPRKVLNLITGNGKMYEISQTQGETYQVNEDHILTLHMPDHKVIFWNSIGWSMLWWDKQTNGIKTKFIKAINKDIVCNECGIVLQGNIKRHYRRCHNDKEAPTQPRKSPTTIPDMTNENIKKAYNAMKEFANSIDNNNIIDMSIKDYMQLTKTHQSRLAGVRGECVNWEYQPVELDPYVLGLWLGDGFANGVGYACGDEDCDVLVAHLNEWGKENDALFKKSGNAKYSISSIINRGKKGCSPLKKLLEKYNLVNNKHIPQEYIVNSREVRLKVLAGLIDTDGTVFRDGTRVQISQGMMHETLIMNTLQLARSLGFYCTLSQRKVQYTLNGEKKESEAFTLNISGNIEDIPTKLLRKKCSRPKSRNTDKSTGQVRIKEIEDGDYVGIKIDGNERFLINDFTVTHNCSNIFSNWFEIETVDRVRKLNYKQRFEANMTVTNKPTITKYSKKPYTSIKFKPDYEKFKIQSLTNDMMDMLVKRVYDACAVTDNDITVYFNDTKLEYKNFEKYVDLYLGSKTDHTRVYEQISDRWEIVASYNDFNGFDQISFVNGIWTLRGGKHVEYILNQIVKKLTEMIIKKNKNANIKPQNIRDNLILFVKSTIVNPSFDSQSKETLTTPISKFGSKAEVSDKFIEKLYKTGIAEKVMEICEMNNNKDLKKTDGKKKSVIKGIPKLDDANWAGTNKSKECTLILTEGDSAKTMVLAGISQVGRDKYGVFPLKGKVMNVKDTNIKKITDNEEISNLKKILGLETGKEYTSLDDLRYGRIMLMCDADHDGFHIRSLVFNLFQTLWPSLFKTDNFLTTLLTPIVKATNNQDKKNTISFYCNSDYESWKKEQEDNGTLKRWRIKYYKGLGTSTNEEAKQYFKDLKIVTYKYTKDESDFSIDLAFNKKKADERKDWLSKYNRKDVLDYTSNEVTFEDSINKELIHFSNYDIERSIPSLVDGLKISQRKILYACFKRNLVSDEIRVAQLASYVSEHACYHHGEASLQSAIIAMAQNFVGANNINLLKPNGQFGSTVQGGKDAGAPRYIYTLLEKITQVMFNKQDNGVLTYLNDDGINIEPEYYVPVIPLVLINGAIGIGTGFSTNIPSYNPIEIIAIIKSLLNDEDIEFEELVPWYMGFEGTIESNNDKFVARGCFKKLSATKVEITELPVGTWTEDYKVLLEEMTEKDVKQYESHCSDKKVHFILQFQSADVLDAYMTIASNGYTKFENDFKLVSSKNLGTTNMYLYNNTGQIQKYNTALDIILEFYQVRLTYYTKRKQYVIEQLEKDMEIMRNKIRFIKAVVNEEVKVSKLKKIELEKYLETNNYLLVNDTHDYLLRIPIYNLTKDKVAEIEDEYKKAEQNLNDIRNKTEKQMWLEELGVFEKEYIQFKEDYYNKLHDNEDSSSTKKKRIAKK
jgi:DNA topoisomerase-2